MTSRPAARRSATSRFVRAVRYSGSAPSRREPRIRRRAPARRGRRRARRARCATAGPVWRIARSVPDLDRQRAAGELHVDRRLDLAVQHRGDGDRAGAGAAGARLADAPLPDAHVDVPCGRAPVDLDVRALRQPRVVLEQRPVAVEREGVDVVRPGWSTCGLPTETKRCGYGKSSPFGRYAAPSSVAVGHATPSPSRRRWTRAGQVAGHRRDRTSRRRSRSASQRATMRVPLPQASEVAAVGVDDRHADARAVRLAAPARRRRRCPCARRRAASRRRRQRSPPRAPRSTQQVRVARALPLLQPQRVTPRRPQEAARALASQRSIVAIETHSSGWCACDDSPGP